MDVRGLYTDFWYFDTKGKKQEKKNIKLLNSFLFKRLEFFLADGGDIYEVCTTSGGELYSIWYCRKGAFSNFQEAANLFRREAAENGINQEKIDLFGELPLN